MDVGSARDRGVKRYIIETMRVVNTATENHVNISIYILGSLSSQD